MLSSIARAALTRVVARAPSTTRSALIKSQFAHADVSRQALLTLVRFYAAATTRASTAKSTSRTSGARKTTTAKKTSSTAGKKKPARKAATKKPVRKATKAKKKKTKKAAVRPKKVLSERQKALKVQAKDKVARDRLRVTGLIGQEPTLKLVNTYLIYYTAHQKGKGSDIVNGAKQFAAQYKSLSPAEREQLNHERNQNETDNATTYKRWVESHTPEAIRQANLARRQLARKSTLKNKAAFRPIHDARQPSRAVNQYSLFVQERHASGDFRGITGREAFKLIAAEWKALSEAERAKYADHVAADKKRYHDEYLTVYKHAPGQGALKKA